MPYINSDHRPELDKSITMLVDTIIKSKSTRESTVNYSISKLLGSILLKDGINYHNINLLVGALECAKLEFYRRIVSYEESKINSDTNGDLPEYDRINKTIIESEQKDRGSGNRA